jgi:hypothetical protein
LRWNSSEGGKKNKCEQLVELAGQKIAKERKAIAKKIPKPKKGKSRILHIAHG